MHRIAVDQLQVLVCVDEARRDANGAKGKLFEAFVATVLSKLGYSDPTTSSLNVTADGIEIDVSAVHRLDSTPLLAECKAYGKSVASNMLDAFYGKLMIARYEDPNVSGLFAALPRLTASGEEQVRLIQKNDRRFTYLNAASVAMHLESLGLLADVPAAVGLLSDPMVIISEHGVYQAALRLDPDSRSAEALTVWSASGQVPSAVLTLLRQIPLAAGLTVVDLSPSVGGGQRHLQPASSAAIEEPVLARVAASSGDFEYQFPAAPRFFVGRKGDLSELLALVRDSGAASIVLNAQSGWGKSSLALRLAHETEGLGGASLVLDARTAASPAYVPAALQRAATAAQSSGLLRLPDDAAFASVASSLATLEAAEWLSPEPPMLIFFDQFENVFRDEQLTRAFRDLVLGLRELRRPLKVGFAWKTDLVGWTEGHPYRLRDEIRSASRVVVLAPLGPDDISTLLSRLQKAVGVKLERDLRDRLREYSAGLPWLFKKLAGHLIDELAKGVTQQHLLEEALNVQGLFDADLASLNPEESAALRQIARLAPVPVGDLSDLIDTPVVQSLLDARLIVQVGERLDTYWDIFRDYLNTGTVPIKEGFILRLNPSQSMGRILGELLARGGPLSVADAAISLATSEAVIFNTVRDLRLVGLVSYESGNIRLPEAISLGDDAEAFFKRRAATTLRRHRVHDLIVELLELSGTGVVEISEFAKSLAAAFPAVNARPATWDQYARAFAYWLAYAGLFGMTSNGVTARASDTVVDLSLLSRSGRVSVSGAFPQSAARPAIQLGHDLATGVPTQLTGGRLRKAKSALTVLGVLHPVDSTQSIDMSVFLPDGSIDRQRLRNVLEERISGAQEALTHLTRKPDASPLEVGLILREAQSTSWTPSSVRNAGKHFRSWAREAGVITSKHATAAQNEPKLFES